MPFVPACQPGLRLHHGECSGERTRRRGGETSGRGLHLRAEGRRTGGQGVNRDTYNDLRRNHPEALRQIELGEKEDKTLCIVDFFGNKYALVGWRNNSSYSISMPKLCKLIKKDGKYYIKYKDKLIKISGGSGWVL